MLLPSNSLGWGKFGSHTRVDRSSVTRPRALILVVLALALFVVWKGIQSSSESMRTYYCWGPPMAPMDMSPNEQNSWRQHLKTPVIFNNREPVRVGSKAISHHNLNEVKSTTDAIRNQERVLVLIPLKDASSFIPHFLTILEGLTYPHNLIDVAILISDTTDDTLALISTEMDRIQKGDGKFNHVTIIEKDFNYQLSQDVQDRHSFEAQGPRRMTLGRARNFLLTTALQPEHSWVFWCDVDINEMPNTIVQDMISHNRDIVVPNVWYHLYDEEGKHIDGRYDYNLWQESDYGRKFRQSLHPDVVLAEGYWDKYDLKRTYMCRMGDKKGDKNEEIELDGIGGVVIMVKADVHRSGINFPAYPFKNQAETEGFAQMARQASYEVIGLPNYIVWHHHDGA